MIGEIFRYIATILVCIMGIACIISIIEVAIKGPIKKTPMHRIAWIIICISYIGFVLFGVSAVIYTLKG